MDPYNAPSIIARQPSSVPISESENTDVIALRAAISVLQMQRETARRDIRNLEGMRDQALQDPDGYVRALVTRVNSVGTGMKKDVGLLDESLKYAVEGLWVKGVDQEQGDKRLRQVIGDAEPKSNQDVEMAGTKAAKSDEDSDSDSSEEEDEGKFGAPPKAQNIVRMPPVNWAKYQVVGDSLDKLHNAQRQRPTPGAPYVDMDADDEMGPDEYMMAGPYDPYRDQGRLRNDEDGWSANVGPSGDHPMQTRRAARRHIG
jgi:hypothetical protein